MDIFSKLVCDEPNSKIQPKLRVGASGSKECLEIQLPDGVPVDGPNSVQTHDPISAHYLGVDKFHGTLQQWMYFYKEDPQFCQLQQAELQEKRPSEHLRRVLEGIFKAVCKMLRGKKFHGYLRFPQNYVLEATSSYSGIGVPYSVSVTIIYAHGDFSTGVGGHVSEEMLRQYMANDIQDVCYLAFKTLLGVNEDGTLSDGVSRLPQDLEHLRQIMAPNHPHRFDLKGTELYAHPGLWDCQRRVRYYAECVAMVYSVRKRKDIQNDLDTMSCVKGWYNMIDNLDPNDERWVVFKREGVYYKADDGLSVLRYASALALHSLKAEEDLENMRIDKLIRDTFPGLLVESHSVMARHKKLL